MFKIIREKAFGKSFAVVTAMTFLFQIAYPTFSYGLTSGPSQPEVESFSSINTSDMVDLFSGDFSYNIPLMNVPGPNGGYPINLGYNAGIGVEQEASWVGLGWNINPGVINRQVKSLPDDFNGDEIKKSHYQKPNRTFGLNIPAKIPLSAEIFGADLELLNDYTVFKDGNGNQTGSSFNPLKSISLIFNSYKGFDIGFNQRLTSITEGSLVNFEKNDDGETDVTKGNLLPPRKSFKESVEGLLNNSYIYRYYRNSRIIKKIEEANDIEQLTSIGLGYGVKQDLMSIAINASDNRGSSLPKVTLPFNTTSFEFKLNLGAHLSGSTFDGDFEGLYVENKIADNNINFKSYGYLYSEGYDYNDEDEKLLDFEVSQEFSPSGKSKTLGVPAYNKDVFYVKGEGVGGVISLNRSDIGILKNPTVKNSDTKVGLGIDLSFGDGIKVGVNPNLNITTFKSGDWSSGYKSIRNLYRFRTNKAEFGTSRNINRDDFPTYENAYFDVKGELVPDNWENKMVESEEPLKFDLTTSLQSIISTKPAPRVKNIIKNDNGKNYNSSKHRLKRKTRAQSYEFLTVKDLKEIDESINFPSTNYTPPSNSRDHHIGQISTTTTEGLTYVYGLPAYNNTKEEYIFSINYSYAASPYRNKNVLYENGDISDRNRHGREWQFTKTVTPAYAHSFLLTEIRSADYIDADGNNIISDDDLGGYVKFNYDKAHSNFQWRNPVSGTAQEANFLKGIYSDSEDDKATVTYGKKEIYYLEEIETRTHVAVFKTSAREDGLGVTGVAGTLETNQKLKKLDEINLYEKADYIANGPSATPIKTVHFKYDYSLAQGIPNTTQSPTTDTTGGKLTLKKVYFTYGGYKTKSVLNPYEFDYHETIAAENPDYRKNYQDSDRWGNYQKEQFSDSFPFISNLENPYTNQLANYNRDTTLNANDEAERQTAAGVWSLKEIHIPSGGTIKINYEQDDYAYVQNLRAMQMCRIIGTTNGVNTGTEISYNDKLIIELIKPTDDQAELDSYFEGLKTTNTYFKAWVQLKKVVKKKDKFSGTAMKMDKKACDYVEGYSKIDSWGFKDQDPETGKYTSAWVKLTPVESSDVKIGKLNPIRAAALQYIAVSRPDLASSPPLNVEDFANLNPISAVDKIIQMIRYAKKNLDNPFLKGIRNGYAKRLNVLESEQHKSKPSYIRLNSPNYKKYGGGHRVKQITVVDNWSSMTNSNEEDYDYGQTFDYTLEDGEKSSGVAVYEPLAGGEENPFRQPVFGSSSRYLYNDPSKMAEEPMAEPYFPSAQVGYSRVVVKSLKRTDEFDKNITTATSGYSVNEFYTAKDYPVITKKTTIEKVNTGTPFSDFIKFIGGDKFLQPGYSQGYYIETNNMHGQQKSVATYPYLAEPQEANATSLSRFIYKTKGGYSEGKVNKLLSTADILLNDGEIKSNVSIGKQSEFFFYMNENNLTSYNTSTLTNVSQLALLAFIPFAILKLDNSSKIERTIVTNKIVHKTGILEKVITTREGSAITTENLLFDSETGNPLLTSITTNYHNANTPELNKIYNYQYPGHWSYEGMGGAYQNIGAIITEANYADILYPGDMILGADNEVYWVDEIDNPDYGLVTKDVSDNSVYTVIEGSKVIRSGRRNQQSIVTGSITSLYNPMDASNTEYTLFDKWNSTSVTFTGGVGQELNEFDDCLGNEAVFTPHSTMYNNLPAIKFEDTSPSACGDIYVVFPNTGITGLENYDLQRVGNTAIATWNGKKYLCKIIDENNCHVACMDGILNASSVTFSDNLGYEESTLPSGISPSVMNSNEYRYGKKGVWKQEHQAVFREDRKQSNGTLASRFKTKSQIDGTYSNFVPYNWLASVNDNGIWTRANTVTKYDAYGNELENENALNIYASALYGYQNTLTTAVINNAKYTEVAFDGYEDYGSSPSSPYNHGNFSFSGTGVVIDNTNAHTGSSSIKVPTANATCTYDVSTGEDNEKYILNFWVKGDISSSTIPATVVVGATTYNAEILAKVDDWYNAEVVFDKATASSVTINLAFSSNRSFDDIRLQPFNSVLKTYVYHPQNFRLLAELDENNFATFYNYDEEGKLIQIKKETSRGIQTLQNNRTVLQSSLNP